MHLCAVSYLTRDILPRHAGLCDLRDSLCVRSFGQLGDFLVCLLLKPHLLTANSNNSVGATHSYEDMYSYLKFQATHSYEEVYSYLFLEELVLHTRHCVLVFTVRLKHRFFDLKKTDQTTS